MTHWFLQLHWLLRHFDFVERLCVVSCTLCSGACFSKRRNRIRAPDAKHVAVNIHVQEASNKQQCTLLHNARFCTTRKPRQVSLASHTVSSNPPHSCFNISSSTTHSRVWRKALVLVSWPASRLLAASAVARGRILLDQVALGEVAPVLEPFKVVLDQLVRHRTGVLRHAVECRSRRCPKGCESEIKGCALVPKTGCMTACTHLELSSLRGQLHP